MDITRRGFLAGLGAGLLAGLGGPRALGQPLRRARRLVVFFSPNGTIHRHWRPTGAGASFRFPAGGILEPLEAIREEVVILDGIDFRNGTNHEGGMRVMLTGGGGRESLTGGASVDQFVARQLAADTPLASLDLGVQTSAWGGNTQTRMAYSEADRFVAPRDRPLEVYRALFGEAEGPADARLALKRSVLDTVRDEIRALRARVPAEERARLDAHLESLRDVERSLAAAAGAPAGACQAPSQPAADPSDNDAFPQVGRAQMDLLVAALSCDRTRVASIQWSHTVSPTVFSWLGIGEGHHALSHSSDGNRAGVADFVRAERWFAEQFVYLVTRLAELPEPAGDGRMLDHTLIVWAKELGDSRLHNNESVPFVLAGQAGGLLSTGRYLDFGGVPHQRLLVSLCRGMGLDNPTFGDPSFGTGPLDGLLG